MSRQWKKFHQFDPLLKRLYLPRESALMVAYFTLNTWTFEIFDTCPYFAGGVGNNALRQNHNCPLIQRRLLPFPIERSDDRSHGISHR